MILSAVLLFLTVLAFFFVGVHVVVDDDGSWPRPDGSA